VIILNTMKNSTDIRTNNLRRILRILHGSKPLTKTYLAEQTDLSFPTILNLLSVLQESGLIEEVGYGSSSGGRKPMCFQFNNKARFSVGIDVNTHHIFYSFTNLGGEVLYTEEFKCEFDGTVAYWKNVSDTVEAMIDRLELDRSASLGICISLPTLMFSYEPEPGQGFVPIDEIASHFKEAATVVTAAEVAGISYLWHKGLQGSAFVILLDRYIEAALLEYDPLTGHIVSRPNDLAHMTISRAGRPCVCGKRGCLQTYCSASNIIDTVNGIDTSGEIISGGAHNTTIDYWEFFRQMDAGNAEFAALWDEYMEILATLVSNLHIILGTDIIIGGEMLPHIKNYYEQFCDKLRKASGNEDISYVCLGLFAKFDKAISAALSLCDKYLAALPVK